MANIFPAMITSNRLGRKYSVHLTIKKNNCGGFCLAGSSGGKGPLLGCDGGFFVVVVLVFVFAFFCFGFGLFFFFSFFFVILCVCFVDGFFSLFCCFVFTYLAFTIFPALNSTISSNPTANMSGGKLSSVGKKEKSYKNYYFVIFSNNLYSDFC